MPTVTINHNHIPKDCANAIIHYYYLETKIRESVSLICAPFCSKCDLCCCREDICRESIDSYWLNLVWQTHGHDISSYDKQNGWFTSKGCQLFAGRPPVCYEYFCNKILNVLRKGPYKQHLKEISSLISLAGKNALGNKHLITLSKEQILYRTNFKKLISKFSICLHLYDQYNAQIIDVRPNI